MTSSKLRRTIEYWRVSEQFEERCFVEDKLRQEEGSYKKDLRPADSQGSNCLNRGCCQVSAQMSEIMGNRLV